MALPVVVRDSAIHGRGVFATRALAAGTRIGEYTGERITREEALHRDDDLEFGDHPTTYRFAIDDIWLIDASTDGNDTRFINHGCEPNCIAVTVAERIYIDACRDIPRGGELLLDYKLATLAPPTDEEKKAFACYCGAPSCRGTMLKRPETSERSHVTR